MTAMNATPPDDRPETHELRTRSADAYLDCCRSAPCTAARYGDRLLAAYWPNRPVPGGFEGVATGVDPGETPWPHADRVLAVPGGADHLDALFDEGPQFTQLAVVRGGEPILECSGGRSHLVATVTVPGDAPELAEGLGEVASGHAGILTPVAVLATWSDGEWWYEVAAGSLYVMTEDPDDGDWTERRTTVSQTGHELVGLKRIAIDQSDRRIDLGWADVDRTNPIERAFGPVIDWLAAEPPATLAFDDEETFETAANGLLAGVGDDRRL